MSRVSSISQWRAAHQSQWKILTEPRWFSLTRWSWKKAPRRLPKWCHKPASAASWERCSLSWGPPPRWCWSWWTAHRLWRKGCCQDTKHEAQGLPAAQAEHPYSAHPQSFTNSDPWGTAWPHGPSGIFQSKMLTLKSQDPRLAFQFTKNWRQKVELKK